MVERTSRAGGDQAMAMVMGQLDGVFGSLAIS